MWIDFQGRRQGKRLKYFRPEGSIILVKQELRLGVCEELCLLPSLPILWLPVLWLLATRKLVCKNQVYCLRLWLQ